MKAKNNKETSESSLIPKYNVISEPSESVSGSVFQEHMINLSPPKEK